MGREEAGALRRVSLPAVDLSRALHAVAWWSDPIFRLAVERALWVYWECVGQPDTKPIRRRWPPRESGT